VKLLPGVRKQYCYKYSNVKTVFCVKVIQERTKLNQTTKPSEYLCFTYFYGLEVPLGAWIVIMTVAVFPYYIYL